MLRRQRVRCSCNMCVAEAQRCDIPARCEDDPIGEAVDQVLRISGSGRWRHHGNSAHLDVTADVTIDKERRHLSGRLFRHNSEVSRRAPAFDLFAAVIEPEAVLEARHACESASIGAGTLPETARRSQPTPSGSSTATTSAPRRSISDGEEAARRSNLKDALSGEIDAAEIVVDGLRKSHRPMISPTPGMSME